jgi:hypothetical protein
MRYFPIAIIVVAFAASALADAGGPSLPNSSGLGNAALDSFQHGNGLKPQLIDNAMLPDGLTKLPAIPAPKQNSATPSGPPTPFAQVAHLRPGTLPIFYRPLDWYGEEIAILSKSLAANPGDRRLQIMIYILQQERDHARISPLGDFDTTHERQIRQAPGLPQSVGQIGLPPGGF